MANIKNTDSIVIAIGGIKIDDVKVTKVADYDITQIKEADVTELANYIVKCALWGWCSLKEKLSGFKKSIRDICPNISHNQWKILVHSFHKSIQESLPESCMNRVLNPSPAELAQINR